MQERKADELLKREATVHVRISMHVRVWRVDACACERATPGRGLCVRCGFARTCVWTRVCVCACVCACVRAWAGADASFNTEAAAMTLTLTFATAAEHERGAVSACTRLLAEISGQGGPAHQWHH